MKITVNQQSKGKPENPYTDATYNRTEAINFHKFRESHPELICLTPTGELAGEGSHETDGKRVWFYKMPNEKNFTADLNHDAYKRGFQVWYDEMKGIADFETAIAYIVTTPANEQPKEGSISQPKKTQTELWVQKHLLSEGWEQNNFGVISCPLEGGSMNLTYVVADIIEAYKRDNGPSLAPVDESVEERAERVYGNDPNMYGAQRDGFIAGYNECLKEHVRLDDVVRVLDGYVWDGKILASDLSEIANKLYSLNKNTNE